MGILEYIKTFLGSFTTFLLTAVNIKNSIQKDIAKDDLNTLKEEILENNIKVLEADKRALEDAKNKEEETRENVKRLIKESLIKQEQRKQEMEKILNENENKDNFNITI